MHLQKDHVSLEQMATIWFASILTLLNEQSKEVYRAEADHKTFMK